MASTENSPTVLAIGIDGGATHVKWCVRASPQQIHEGECAGANRQLMDWDDYRARLLVAIDAALAAAGADRPAIGTIGLGLAGVSRPEEIDPLKQWLRESLPGLHRCWVGNDALPALREGAGRLEGIVLIAGTGSICLGVTADGRMVRVGGWGGLIGDEGSAFWIGREALQVAARMSDGRRPRTALLDRLLEHLKLEQPDQLIRWTYARKGEEQKIAVAELAPLIVHLATEDLPAREIVKRAVVHLALHVQTAAQGLDRLPGARRGGSYIVVCAGGIFTAGVVLLDALSEALSENSNRFILVLPTHSAAQGALALGEELGD